LGNPLMVGLALAGLSLLVLVISLRQKTWLKAANLTEEKVPQGPSPLEQALALLITDIVAERQVKRKNQEPSGP
jgi:hypothetical protein